MNNCDLQLSFIDLIILVTKILVTVPCEEVKPDAYNICIRSKNLCIRYVLYPYPRYISCEEVKTTLTLITSGF